VTVGLCPVCAARPPPHAVVCPNDNTVLVSADADPLVGTVVSGWRVLRRIGLGGMGAVYEVLEDTIAKRAALKVVHPHLSLDPKLPTLLAEARAVNAIGDEGIVDVYGFGTLPDGRSWLVMELLEGELLETQLHREGKLTLLEAIDVVVPIFQALEAAHAAGFVHRDLKPANVFIVKRSNRAPFPKLLDFGIAQRIKVGAPDALGTAGYVSPEQAANVNVGAKADLYSMGCLFYELVTGRLPFVDRDWNEVLRQHREAPRPSLKAVVKGTPESLETLFKSLLAVEPLRRPPSAAAVRTALLQVRAELTGEARSTVTPRRSVLPVVAVGLALAAAVTAVVLRPPEMSGTVAPTPVVDPVAAAAASTAAEVQAALTGPRDLAVDRLLAAKKAFPSRPEWVALTGQLEASLRLDVEGALKKDDAEAATRALTLMEQLGTLEPTDPLRARVDRTSFALHNGMVHVGDVFIDKYEHPNREGQLPTTEVDYAGAVQLCERAGKHLCTEQEWERACRGQAALAYPWGDKLDKERCVTRGKGVKGPAKSGAKPRCVGPAGVFDLTGNVAEWTSSPLREGAEQRVIRGGSFAQSDAQLSCTARDYQLPGLGGSKHLGLRCCK
jgi:tRNA A-37 threonylcarbamoyl transferase component Bud32